VTRRPFRLQPQSRCRHCDAKVPVSEGQRQIERLREAITDLLAGRLLPSCDTCLGHHLRGLGMELGWRETGGRGG
jgi:hypothetical protein